jgi:hypothetical protein
MAMSSESGVAVQVGVAAVTVTDTAGIPTASAVTVTSSAFEKPAVVMVTSATPVELKFLVTALAVPDVFAVPPSIAMVLADPSEPLWPNVKVTGTVAPATALEAE